MPVHRDQGDKRIVPTFDKITLRRLRVPLLTPYHLAFGAVEHFDTIVVETVDRAGQVGLGEATILTGYTDETIDDSWRVARQLAVELVRLGYRDAKAKVYQLGAKFPFTATSFGTALEMLTGNELLRLSGPASVPLVGLLSAMSDEAIAIEVERLLAQGYRTIKVKVGFDVAADIRRIVAVQRVVNGRAGIRIDANQGYTAAEGVAFVEALAPTDIELFEQPCAAGDWESHLAVARASPVPMMLDESIYALADIEKAAALDAARYVKVKLMKLVTLDGLAAAIERIKALGMRAVLGNGVACDLGCWMEACVAARCIDNAGEMNGFLKACSPLLTESIQLRDGALRLEPGFSPRLDVARIEPYVVDTATFAASVTNYAAL